MFCEKETTQIQVYWFDVKRSDVSTGTGLVQDKARKVWLHVCNQINLEKQNMD